MCADVRRFSQLNNARKVFGTHSDHRVNLGDSLTSSTRIRFSVHTVVAYLLIRLQDAPNPVKHIHEFRDPIHTFISFRTDERRVIDSMPFQSASEYSQLALTYLVYPGATHKRFEHSLGVMELASRIFDVVTNPQNVFHDSVREIVPDEEGKRYWRR